MNFKNLFYALSIFLVLTSFYACGGEDTSSDTQGDDFDHTAMLTHWADNIIIPSYQNFNTETQALKNSSDNFIAEPTTEHLNSLRNAWEDAYIAWQRVAMFEIGPADDVFMRPFLNIYPTNSSSIDNLIMSGEYDLTNPNLTDEQGFPALDYLLYGMAESEAEIVQLFTGTNATQYKNYLESLVNRINSLANQVLSSWQTSYRDIFIANTGTSANSSINRMANAYLEYYERFFRNGKIGFPAGIFSDQNTTNPEIVEAFYRKNLSKTLCLTALDALSDFFNGISANGNPNGSSFKAYLDYLNTIKDGANLSDLINDQFLISETVINGLNDSFYEQINSDNAAMLTAFETLQDKVVLLKSDMFSALSLTVEFQSGDGD
jgi:predicted lipoprotein